MKENQNSEMEVTQSNGISDVKKERKRPTNKQESISNVQLIPNTPFACVERGKNDFVIVFGKHLITATVFSSFEHAQKWANQIDWNSLINVVGIYVEHALSLKHE